MSGINTFRPSKAYARKAENTGRMIFSIDRVIARRERTLLDVMICGKSPRAPKANQAPAPSGKTTLVY